MIFHENQKSELRKNVESLLQVLSNRMHNRGSVKCTAVSNNEYLIEIHDMVSMFYDVFTVYEINGECTWCNGPINRKREITIH